MVRFTRYASLIMAGLLLAFGLSFGFLFGPEWVNEQRSDTVWLVCLLGAGLLGLTAFWVGRAPLKPDVLPEERLAHNVQRVLSLLLVAFLMLSLQLMRNQIVIAGQVSEPYFTPDKELVQDPRLVSQDLRIQRGRIFDTYGNQVAGIQVEKGLVKRTYQNVNINPLLGYYSPLQFGNSGIEAAYDDYLSGKQGANPFAALTRDLLHYPQVGNDLYLTIEPDLQQFARQQLGNVDGAVVLLDAKTGEVLVMAGNPTYDPAQLAFDPTVDDTLWDAQIKEIQKRWAALNTDSRSPLLFRPTQGLYTPGSIFKTITLSAALDSGKITPDTVWQDNGKLVVDGAVFNDPNRPNQTKTDWTTTEGYMFSLNAVFGQIGLQVGGTDLQRYMEKFGFNQKIPFDLPVNPSLPYTTKNFLNSRSGVASTGFGQGEILVTPLQMALVAATFGREDGAMPKPVLVKEIRTHEGVSVKKATPETWLRPVLPETARNVRDIMVQSATKGWVGLNGGNLSGTGATVGGKTGTAEVDTANLINNGWYIAWASKGNRTFAIAVVVDHRKGAEGLRDAMPRANEILKRALAKVQ